MRHGLCKNGYYAVENYNAEGMVSVRYAEEISAV